MLGFDVTTRAIIRCACIRRSVFIKRHCSDASSVARRMDKVAEASFNGLRGLVAAEDVEAGQHAMTVSLSEGLFVLSGRQKSSPLPDWFVSPTFFTAEHG